MPATGLVARPVINPSIRPACRGSTAPPSELMAPPRNPATAGRPLRLAKRMGFGLQSVMGAVARCPSISAYGCPARLTLAKLGLTDHRFCELGMPMNKAHVLAGMAVCFTALLGLLDKSAGIALWFAGFLAFCDFPGFATHRVANSFRLKTQYSANLRRNGHMAALVDTGNHLLHMLKRCCSAARSLRVKQPCGDP